MGAKEDKKLAKLYAEVLVKEQQLREHSRLLDEAKKAYEDAKYLDANLKIKVLREYTLPGCRYLKFRDFGLTLNKGVGTVITDNLDNAQKGKVYVAYTVLPSIVLDLEEIAKGVFTKDKRGKLIVDMDDKTRHVLFLASYKT